MASPFERIEWNEYEVALLIDAYRKVDKQEVSRVEAVSMLSRRLRNGVLLRGVEISDRYRNENGINLQMSAIENCLTKGESGRGISSYSKLFAEISGLYLNNPSSYSRLLEEAKNRYPAPDGEVDPYDEEGEDNCGANTPMEENPDDEESVVKNILIKHFKKGYRTTSYIDRKRFSELYRMERGEDVDDEYLQQLIYSCGIEFDQKIFVPEVMMSPEVREQIAEFISSSFTAGKETIYYGSLIKKFQEELLDGVIVSGEMLCSYLKFYYGDQWFFREEFVSARRGAFPNIDNVVIEFVREQGKPVSEEDVVKFLDWLPEDQVRQAFRRNYSVLISSENGKRFHISLLVINDEQIKCIEKIINDAIGKYEFISTEELISSIKTLIPEIFTDNSSISEVGIRKAILVKLENKFSINNTIICRRGANIDSRSILLNFARGREEFKLEEIIDLAETLNVELNYYLEDIERYSLRISEDRFMKSNRVYFKIADTDRAIDKTLTEGTNYMPLKKITNFSFFPECIIPWNQRLLESFLIRFSRKFKLLYSRTLSKYDICGAVVRVAGCKDWTFEEVAARALVDNNISLNKNEALDFLADEGYIVRRRYGEIENVLQRANVIKSNV